MKKNICIFVFLFFASQLHPVLYREAWVQMPFPNKRIIKIYFDFHAGQILSLNQSNLSVIRKKQVESIKENLLKSNKKIKVLVESHTNNKFSSFSLEKEASMIRSYKEKSNSKLDERGLEGLKRNDHLRKLLNSEPIPIDLFLFDIAKLNDCGKNISIQGVDKRLDFNILKTLFFAFQQAVFFYALFHDDFVAEDRKTTEQLKELLDAFSVKKILGLIEESISFLKEFCLQNKNDLLASVAERELEKYELKLSDLKKTYLKNRRFDKSVIDIPLSKWAFAYLSSKLYFYNYSGLNSNSKAFLKAFDRYLEKIAAPILTLAPSAVTSVPKLFEPDVISATSFRGLFSEPVEPKKFEVIREMDCVLLHNILNDFSHDTVLVFAGGAHCDLLLKNLTELDGKVIKDTKVVDKDGKTHASLEEMAKSLNINFYSELKAENIVKSHVHLFENLKLLKFADFESF